MIRLKNTSKKISWSFKRENISAPSELNAGNAAIVGASALVWKELE